MGTETPVAKLGTARSRLRRWGRRGVLLLVGVALLLLFHAPLLRGLARACIYEDSDGPVDRVVLAGGTVDDCLELRPGKQHQRFLLVPYRPSRVVRLKLAPSSMELFEQELHARGIASEAIASLPGEVRNERAFAVLLRDWLAAHPDETVLLRCHRFQSRRMHWHLGDVLTPAERQRVRLRPGRGTSYDESTWWRSRDGILVTCQECMRLAILLLRGSDAEEGHEWEPEEYERLLPLSPDRPVPAAGVSWLGCWQQRFS